MSSLRGELGKIRVLQVFSPVLGPRVLPKSLVECTASAKAISSATASSSEGTFAGESHSFNESTLCAEWTSRPMLYREKTHQKSSTCKTLKKRTGRIIPTKERAKVLWRRPGRSKGLKRRKAYRPPRKQHADGAEIAVSLSTVDVGEKIWPSGGGH